MAESIGASGEDGPNSDPGDGGAADDGADPEDPEDPEDPQDPQDPQDPDPASNSDPEPAPSGCTFDLVWPTTGSATTETIVHDAYGPRLLASGFDWHRGVDLPGDPNDGGFYDPVFAVADGSIYAIGNRPNPGQGALAGYGNTAGNVIVLEHEPSDLRPGADTLYTVYMHLQPITLEAFPARFGDGEIEIVDLREYYYVDGPAITPNNRGRRRDVFKTSGDLITAYPRVAQRDAIAIIGDTGATYEHLHFEVRAGSPNSDDARNPFAYLPHDDAMIHGGSVELDGEGVRAQLEIPRAPGAIGADTDLEQQIDIETVALQILDANDEVVDELRFDFLSLGRFEEPDRGAFEIEGAVVRLSPADFSSASDHWRVGLDFTALAEAGLSLAPGERYGLEIVDLCGNRFTTAH